MFLFAFNIIYFSDYNFTQKPVFIEVGDEIGSEYYGFDKVINVPNPSIEANSRPWHTGYY